MKPLNLYLDGGGTPTVPTYFSYKVIEEPWIQIKKMLTRDIPTTLIPKGCSFTRTDGTETNNIAEYAALYYGLLGFKIALGPIPVNVFHDSQNVVLQVLRERNCNAPHLRPWKNAVLSIWWDEINYIWVRRNSIKKVLGH